MQTEKEEDPLDVFFSSLNDKNDKSADVTKQNNNSAEGAAVDEDGLVEEAEEEYESRADDAFQDVFSLKQPVVKELSIVDHSTMTYAPFRKAFYKETQQIAALTQEQVRELRFQLDQMKVRGARCPKPVQTWAQLGLALPMLDVIRRKGYERPTPIQAQAVPAIMSGRDLIGIAKTGSGKTLAFLLPLLRHVLDQPRVRPGQGPIALVMTPTRELAVQTHRECLQFSRHLGLGVACAYGGTPLKEQIGEMRRGPDIVICTPGRWMDLLVANSGRVTNLQRVTFVVLDEADRMFDLGFGPQVVRIVENIRPDKQAVLFSATFPRHMEALARKLLQQPIEILVGKQTAVCSDVTQRIILVNDEDEKFVQLLRVLGEWLDVQTRKVLIFVEKQERADFLLRDLSKRGYLGLTYHSGKEQMDRDAAIADFKAGVCPILIATSLAARGLDVAELNLVVNYDCPNHLEDYVHRAGRTGRAGNQGTAITLVCVTQDDRYAGDLVRALKSSNVPVPAELQKLADLYAERLQQGKAKTGSSGFGGKGLEHIDQIRSSLIQTQKALVLEDSDESETTEATKEEKKKEKSVNQSVIIAPKPPPRPDLAPVVSAAYKKARAVGEQIEARIASTLNLASFPKYDPVAALSAKFKPTTQAFGEIIPVYDPKTISASNPLPVLGSEQPRLYICEVEINEYPQPARLKVTHRDTISGIIEAAGGSGIIVVVRGQYIPANRSIKEGERKLYIRIEGETQHSVEVARSEIRRILLETTTNTFFY